MLGLEYVCKLYDISYLNLANKLEDKTQKEDTAAPFGKCKQNIRYTISIP